jgi:hypothetical protein
LRAAAGLSNSVEVLRNSALLGKPAVAPFILLETLSKHATILSSYNT